jgi:glycosyltransferase involved in cell wall biosynthesis
MELRCPDLRDLPPAPDGRIGWPWTEASSALPATMSDGGHWPRITIVTPSFNQARFIEATIRSILLQGYPNLEYFILDGGSSDRSVEIIKRYEPWLTHWTSEPDGGQSAAINRGLRFGSGLFANWINSDDMLHRNALVSHATSVGFDHRVVYVGDCTHIDEHGTAKFTHRGRVHSLEDLVRIRSVWRAAGERGYIDQPAVLFPRKLALEVGALDVTNHRTMDYELWGNFFLAGADFEYTNIPFGIFRVHAEQKTGQGWRTTQSLIATAVRLVAKAPHIPESVRQEILADLYKYRDEYWRRTGRLARVGLPKGVVCSLRDMHATLRRHASGLVGGAS